MNDLPVRCQLCGELYPDNDALWDHECPEWERVRRQAMPTLASHRNIIQFYENAIGPRWAKRLVLWSITRVCEDLDDPQLLDALLRMPPRYAFKLERRLERRGFLESPEAAAAEWAYRQYEIEEEAEARPDGDIRAAQRTVDGRRRRRQTLRGRGGTARPPRGR